MSEHYSLFHCVDLFAGPGGWDEGIRPLGIRPLGIEWDGAACDTRIAADHETLREDVSTLNPRWYEPCELLIASPPCQAFSIAGKGEGWRDVPLILKTARALCDGKDLRAEVVPKCVDERSLLVVEPLRWALALKPRWIACEQVPGVLALWKVFADLLSQHGYKCWAGTLQAEQYGVPQTRERAFLMASLDAQPMPPQPTHQLYVFGEPPAEQHLLDGTTLEPWSSMAEALGWGADGRPSYTVTAGGGDKGSPEPFAKSAREGLMRELDEGRWVVRTGQDSTLGGGRKERYERDVDAPAPTLMSNATRWTIERPAPTIVTTRRSKDGILVGRQLPDGEGENVGGWGWERPSTIVAGDSRIFQPGGHHEPGKQSQNAVRVNLQEAAILQGFPPEYPFQGNKTEAFRQVGNAIPPPLARAVITALLGSELAGRAAAVAA